MNEQLIRYIIDDTYNNITKGNIRCVTILIEILNKSKITDFMIKDIFPENGNEIYNQTDFNNFINNCKEKHIYGSKLWLAYKYCNKDIDILMDKIKRSDEDMINEINFYINKGHCEDTILIKKKKE